MAINPSDAAAKSSRGKEQIHWGEGVWKALDHAVTHEMMRTRVGAKFLPQVHVHKKQTTVPSDTVLPPQALPAGVPLDAWNVDETATIPINEYSVQFRLSPAQAEAEGHEEMDIGHMATDHPSEAAAAPGHSQETTETGDQHAPGPVHQHHTAMRQHHRASTGVSLVMKTANILAQGEDLYLFNGINAANNSPLFVNNTVQVLSLNLKTIADYGLLGIDQTGVIQLSGTQVVTVFPSVAGAAGPPVVNPLYRENTLNAVAQGVSILQGLGHYGHYALVLNTVPYADLHQALPTTLIEPVEPISHLVKAGVYGTGTLPPFGPLPAGLVPAPPNPGGLPKGILDGTKLAGNVLFTGVLVSLNGNTMDHVRGRMDDNLDAVATYNQKDTNEQHRFRVVQRFAFRLKDPTARILLVFVDAPVV